MNGVLLKPLPYGNPDRLVGAWHDMPPLNMHHAQQTAATYFTYQRLAHTIEGIGIYDEGSVNVSDPGGTAEPQRIQNAWISAGLIPVLQVSPILGRTFTQAEDLPKGPEVVIISETMWRNRFGAAPDIIGKNLEVNGLTRQIVGVMPQHFRFPAAGTQLWLPMAMDPVNPYPGGFNSCVCSASTHAPMPAPSRPASG